MAYTAEQEIKTRMKRVGLTTRDIANLLGEPPGTVGSRLNGFIPLYFNQRRAILEKLIQEEKSKELILGEEY
jgi:DNA-directed RNA polymerase specialized sigma24 family protein